jgi:hypothetical protein
MPPVARSPRAPRGDRQATHHSSLPRDRVPPNREGFPRRTCNASRSHHMLHSLLPRCSGDNKQYGPAHRATGEYSVLAAVTAAVHQPTSLECKSPSRWHGSYRIDRGHVWMVDVGVSGSF